MIHGPSLLRTLELGPGTHITCTNHPRPTKELVANWRTERGPQKRQTSYVSLAGSHLDPLMLVEENPLDWSSHCRVRARGITLPAHPVMPRIRRHDLGWTQWHAGLRLRIPKACLLPEAQTAVRYPGHCCTGNLLCDTACSIQSPPLCPQPHVLIFLPLL